MDNAPGYNHPFVPYPDGRRHGCVRCPWPKDKHPQPDIVERNLAAEHAVLHAARENAPDHPLWEFATQRAFPGGVRVGDRKLRRDFLEELADAINYGVWEVCYDLQPRADAGDSVAGSRIPSRLGAIRKLTEAWDMLHLP